MGRRVAVVMRSRRVTRRGVMEGGKEGEEGVGMSGAQGSSSIAGAIFFFFSPFSTQIVPPCFFFPISLVFPLATFYFFRVSWLNFFLLGFFFV